MIKNIIHLLSAVAILFFFQMISANNVQAQTDSSTEVAMYMNMLKSNNVAQRTEAAKKISGSDLTDHELFNTINVMLLERYQSGPNKGIHIDEMAWLCKALASSGMSEYKTTLQKVADTTSSQKLRKYAIQSLERIDEYAEKNKIMTETQYAAPGQAPEVTRYITMLKSDIPSLKKEAAKKIYRSNLTNPRLFQVVNEEILKSLQSSESDQYDVDTMAWLCKALASSGLAKGH
jgi:DNA-binding Xre family transcriptional regulator